MSTALFQNPTAYFTPDTDESPAVAEVKQTRRFVPAKPAAKLRMVPADAQRTKLRFVPRVAKEGRAAAPSEPKSMMRIGAFGVAGLTLLGSIFVTTSAPASARLNAPAVVEPRADVEFATETPAEVVAPAPVLAPVVTRSTSTTRRATASATVRPSRAVATDPHVDELSDEPAVVVPVDGPRPNPF
jgi:hypothetical protein